MNANHKKQVLHLQIFTFLAGILILSSFSLYSQQSNQKTLSTGWDFYKGDLGGVWEALRESDISRIPNWQTVTVPHCVNAYDAVDPDKKYYQGGAWYRIFIKPDNPYEHGRTILHFMGAGQKTKLWVYNQYVGEHVGGYDEFSFDITTELKEFYSDSGNKEEYNGKVPIVIRTDNSRDLQMIPSDLSDFNLYGGLYRPVKLLYKPRVSFQDLHVTPNFDTTTQKCDVTIEGSMYNPKNYKEEVSISFEILDNENNTIEEHIISVDPSPKKKEFWRFSIDKPKLWSPDNPYLYQVKAELTAGNSSIEISENFGIRYFRFEKHGSFYLNGERLLLRGMSRHEDHAGMGAAMDKGLIRKEMEMMKDIGTNFIRLGHYQQSEYVLDLCDELGILSWEEIPWCRGGIGGNEYKKQARQMLKNLINQHYNHPSIIFWGLGNENDWPGDFKEFDEEEIRSFMSELNDIAHSLDPSRVTSIRRCDFCTDIIDVYSPSIWAGWYHGKYTDYYEVSEKWNEKVDHFAHMEWGGSSHAHRHSEDPYTPLGYIVSDGSAEERPGDFLMKGGDARFSRDGDWSETYICDLIEWHLKEQARMPWHVGASFWIFKDFSTPLRPNNAIPYVNQKGIVERDFTKKAGYYIFKAYWTDEPMARIYGHTWTTRWGEPNEKKTVKVYSNCNKAELFVNGESQGVKHRNINDFPAAGLRWQVQFEEGGNQLRVIAEEGNQKVEDSLKVNYQTQSWEEPSKFIFEEISRSGDTATLRALAVDENAVLCLDAKNFVRFSLAGEGSLIDDLGTAGGASKVQLANGRAWIKVKLNDGRSTVTVNADSIEQNTIKLFPEMKQPDYTFKGFEYAPELPGKREIINKIKLVTDWQLNHMPSQKGHWYRHNDWTNAALYTGVMAAYRATGKNKYLNKLMGFCESVDWQPAQRFRDADDLCIGQTYIDIYSIKKEEKMFKPIKARIDSLIADPKPGRVDWWWCDALYMEPPVLTRLYRVTGDQKYLDYLDKMYWDAWEFLYDKEEHLFYRDERFIIKEDGSGRREPNGNKVFWSRGNGWVLAGLARILNDMPGDYPTRDRYENLFKEMAHRIALVQPKDGLWRPSLLYPQSFDHGETSGSGFFCYALSWGINNGLLEEDTFLPVVKRTWNALDNCVNENGKLGWVQKIGYAPDEISAEMTEVYGVGAYLLTASEIAKMVE